MYSQYLQLQNTKVGKGVFTTVAIPANMMIIEITGPVLTDREIPDMNQPALLQVGPNTFITASGGLDDYINHSCDPNCKMHVVGNRAFLYSLYVIPANSQLTFDYSTTSTDTVDSWQMTCQCGSNKCRKTISGAQYLSQTLLDNYKSRDMLPLYITNPNLIQKR
jgi:SET domain-containing protein